MDNRFCTSYGVPQGSVLGHFPTPVGGLEFLFASILILLRSRLHTIGRVNTKVASYLIDCPTRTYEMTDMAVIRESGFTRKRSDVH